MVACYSVREVEKEGEDVEKEEVEGEESRKKWTLMNVWCWTKFVRTKQ